MNIFELWRTTENDKFKAYDSLTVVGLKAINLTETLQAFEIGEYESRNSRGRYQIGLCLSRKGLFLVTLEFSTHGGLTPEREVWRPPTVDERIKYESTIDE